MYCATCGTTLAPGLSYCNRCGASLKDRSETNTKAIAAFLTAITLIGVIGLGIMLGGAMTLKRDANLGDELVGLFMIFTFSIVGITEFFLVKQLSRLTGTSDKKTNVTPQYQAKPNELPAMQPRTLSEPIPSVTESTTRTLEYTRNKPAQ